MAVRISGNFQNLQNLRVSVIPPLMGGSIMYVAGGNAIFRYDLSTEWDITTASFTNSQVIGQNADLFFRPDGTRMFTINDTSNTVDRYDLSVAWDITTASFVDQRIIVGGTFFGGIFLSPDGTDVFTSQFIGTVLIRGFSLSTPWDITPATSTGNFDPTAQLSFPTGLFFRPDGIRMFVDGASSIFRYDLSVAWDITTATFVNSFNYTGQETNGRGVHFRPDGKQMYISGNTTNQILAFDLSIAWDITTATFNTALPISTQTTSPFGVFFSSI